MLDIDGLSKEMICEIDNYRHRKKSGTDRNRLKKTGITSKEYDTLYKKQKGCCAICGKHNSKNKRQLAVDHDHKTGKIRGLLCVKCNVGLGYFEDSIDNLEKAKKYLEFSGE